VGLVFSDDASGRELIGRASLSIATKNQPLSQGGWVGCDFLIATYGLIKLAD